MRPDSPALDTSFHDNEMGRGPGASEERRWLSWCARAERILGHDLDGDGAADGYSLDGAYDAFLAGETAEAHALAIVGARS